MTEKRFFILKDEEFDDVLPCIRDRNSKINDIYGHYKYDNLEEICNELNRLEEENGQLKQTNQELTQKKNDLKDLLVNSEAVLEQKKLQEIIYKMVIDLIDEKIEKVDTVSAEALKDLKRQLEVILND